jgi:actin-like ATPase involved in cell morphogenesis
MRFFTSDAMFNKFRDTGYFVGNDAYKCAYEHPDPTLRGNLEVRSVIGTDGSISDKQGYSLLYQHAVELVLNNDSEDDGPLASLQNGSVLQIVNPFKISYQSADFKVVGNAIFENEFLSHCCSSALLAPEPSLAALSVLLEPCPTALVVDIGAWSTSVVPVFEGIVIMRSACFARIGGEHCTVAMERMLDSKALSFYSAILSRRRRQIAREIKEKHGFLAESFDECIRKYGSFGFDVVRVMQDASESSNLPSAPTQSAEQAAACNDIRVRTEMAQPDGTRAQVALDRELFYCYEPLFSSLESKSQSRPAQECASIADAIISAVASIEDAGMRVDIGSKIILCGGSANIKGIEARVSALHELHRGLWALGVTEFTVLNAASDGLQEGRAWGHVMAGAQVRLCNAEDGAEAADNCITVDDYGAKREECFLELA